METTIMGFLGNIYWGYRGRLEKQMETTVIGYTGCDIGCIYIYWGYVGIMEKKMESTIMGSIGHILGLYRDDGNKN